MNNLLNSKKILVAQIIFLIFIGLTSADDWPMFMYDLERSGESSDVIENPEDLGIKWEFKTNGSVESQPAVSGNYVYVSSQHHRGHLYCLNKYTGELIWEFETIHTNYYSSISTTPAVAGNYVYFGSTDNYVYCVDKNTGELKWKFKTGGELWSSPAISGNYVYLGSGDGYTYCLDKNTGELKWKFEAGGVYLPVAISGNYIYIISSTNKYLYCIDKNTGEFIWKFKTGYLFSLNQDYRKYIKEGEINEELIKIFKDNNISLYNKTKIHEVTEKNWMIDNKIGSDYLVEETAGDLKVYGRVSVQSHPVVSGNYVYVGGSSIYCLDKKTGELVWQKSEIGRMGGGSSLTVSGKYIYFFHSSGIEMKNNIFCLDKKTGGLVWKSEIGSRWMYNYLPTIVSGNYIYFVSENYVHLVDKNTGELVSNFTVGDSNYWMYERLSPPAISAGYFYIGSYNNYLYAFTTLKPLGAACSNDSECKTKNCIKEVCKEKEVKKEINIIGFLILGVMLAAAILLVFLINKKLKIETAKSKKAKVILFGVLILIIFGTILIADTFDLFKNEVVEKTIKEVIIPEGTISVKITGTKEGIELKTYKDGKAEIEKLPMNNYIFRTEYATVNVYENLRFNISDINEEKCGKCEEEYGRYGRDCCVRNYMATPFGAVERIEIVIWEGDKQEFKLEILRNDDKFKEIITGKEWQWRHMWESCGESPSLESCPDAYIWFVVDNKTLYAANIDMELYKVRNIKEICDVSGMNEKEIREKVEESAALVVLN